MSLYVLLFVLLFVLMYVSMSVLMFFFKQIVWTVLSCLVVVLGMSVLRPFSEKYSMAPWIMIHADMLHFSEKGRSTLMPKTTTRQDTQIRLVLW